LYSRHGHLIGIERLKIAKRNHAEYLHTHFGPSFDILRWVDGIIVASTMQTCPDNTTRVLVHLEQEERNLQERCAYCRVKSRRAARALRAASRSASRPFTGTRPLESRHAANMATRDYYGNRAPSLTTPSRPPTLRIFFFSSLRSQCARSDSWNDITDV